MQIKPITITVKDLYKNYSDDGEGGVYAYDNKLTVRPAYQREFIYKDKQRDAVIDTVRKGFPLNVMYWSVVDDDHFEILDGQQRTISICQYLNSDYSINHRFYHNLTDEEKEQLDNYELNIYLCKGTESEKFEWFKTINIAGAVLTPQELLNATYTGTWLADAKVYFSKRNCAAYKISEGYLKGTPIRQEILEKALNWIADRDGLKTGQQYMAIHQHDKDANDLWVYFQRVINWAKMLFPNKHKGITDSQEWGLLYNKYHDKTYNIAELEEEIKKYILDDEITKSSGIIPYILSDKTSADEKNLSLRNFTEAQKIRAYTKQDGRCPFCLKEGIDKEYTLEEMQADHITPWSKGGRTIDENLQLLCARHNREKAGK